MQAFFYNPGKSCYTPPMPGGRPTQNKPTDFGARLAQARNEAGLSQSQLAEKMSVQRYQIAYWERKSIGLKAEQIVKLADILDVTTDYLLGRSSKPTRRGGPTGKVKDLFEAIASMPRRQQDKVVDILRPFVKEHLNEKAS